MKRKMGNANSSETGFVQEQVDDSNADQEDGQSPLNILNLPFEVLEHILSFVDSKTQVFACRLVCKSFKDAVEDNALRMRALHLKLIPTTLPKQSWFVYYAACKGIFKRNFIMNPYGADQMAGWFDMGHSSNGWQVECPPLGCSMVPEEALVEAGLEKSAIIGCFASTYFLCSKEQLVDLRKHSILSHLMDHLKPWIEVSEWFAPRFDCASVYSLECQILDSSKKVLDSFNFSQEMEQWTEAKWTQVKHVFRNVEGSIRYVKFKHFAQDRQFWRGQYGSKMTLGCVKLLLPE